MCKFYLGVSIFINQAGGGCVSDNNELITIILKPGTICWWQQVATSGKLSFASLKVPRFARSRLSLAASPMGPSGKPSGK